MTSRAGGRCRAAADDRRPGAHADDRGRPRRGARPSCPDDLELNPKATRYPRLADRTWRGVVVHQEYWKSMGTWSPDDWEVYFAVRRDGRRARPAGARGPDFRTLRTVDTSSWLATGVRGTGVGKAMRRAVLALAFDHLGAQAAITSAWHDNHGSLGVSRSLGYRHNGESLMAREGTDGDRHPAAPPDDAGRLGRLPAVPRTCTSRASTPRCRCSTCPADVRRVARRRARLCQHDAGQHDRAADQLHRAERLASQAQAITPASTGSSIPTMPTRVAGRWCSPDSTSTNGTIVPSTTIDVISTHTGKRDVVEVAEQRGAARGRVDREAPPRLHHRPQQCSRTRTPRTSSTAGHGGSRCARRAGSTTASATAAPSAAATPNPSRRCRRPDLRHQSQPGERQAERRPHPVAHRLVQRRSAPTAPPSGRRCTPAAARCSPASGRSRRSRSTASTPPLPRRTPPAAASRTGQTRSLLGATTSSTSPSPTAAPAQRSSVSRIADHAAGEDHLRDGAVEREQGGGHHQVGVAARRVAHPGRLRDGDGQRGLDHPRNLGHRRRRLARRPELHDHPSLSVIIRSGRVWLSSPAGGAAAGTSGGSRAAARSGTTAGWSRASRSPGW